MWKCPKCGREFKNTNQDHYCGDKPANIDEYIAYQSVEVQPILTKVREIIRVATPDATEKVSWSMPTFWQGENLIHFAAFKNHIGIYPGALERLPDELMKRLAPYKTSKGAIQFPYDKVDYNLIEDIIKWRIRSVLNKD